MGVNLGRVSGTRIREVGTRIRTQIHTITHNYTHLHTKLHNITQNIQIYTEYTQKHIKSHNITQISQSWVGHKEYTFFQIYIYSYIYRKLLHRFIVHRSVH